ncbi:hypothetical protein ACFSS8_12785 [Paracoccus kondratievae]
MHTVIDHVHQAGAVSRVGIVQGVGNRPGRGIARVIKTDIHVSHGFGEAILSRTGPVDIPKQIPAPVIQFYSHIAQIQTEPG